MPATGQLRCLWPLNQDRDLGVAHDVVGHTADEEESETASAVSCHGDQIDAWLRHCTQNLGGDLATQDCPDHALHAGCLQTLGDSAEVLLGLKAHLFIDLLKQVRYGRDRVIVFYRVRKRRNISERCETDWQTLLAMRSSLRVKWRLSIWFQKQPASLHAYPRAQSRQKGNHRTSL